MGMYFKMLATDTTAWGVFQFSKTPVTPEVVFWVPDMLL